MHIQIKTKSRPPAFAFVDFEDPRDAEDAVRGRDGIEFADSRLRVEFCRDRSRPPPEPRHRRFPAKYGVEVLGLPHSASWQDLKDFIRRVADVMHTDVDRRGGGTAALRSQEDVDRVIEELDGALFKNSYDEEYVSVRPLRRGGSFEETRGRGQRHYRARERSPIRVSKNQDDIQEKVQVQEKVQEVVNKEVMNEEKNENVQENNEEQNEVTQEENVQEKNEVAQEENVQEVVNKEVVNEEKNENVQEVVNKEVVNEEKNENVQENNEEKNEVVQEDNVQEKIIQEDAQLKDWSSLRVVDLKEELEKVGLDKKGRKAELIKRLEEYYQQRD